MPSDAGDVVRRLLHMRDSITLATSFVENQTYDIFRDDLRTLYACIRCLEIISEASRHLPQSLKERHPAIAWKDIASAGNVYRHDYEDVAARRIWSAIKKDLPSLLNAIDEELKRTDS